MAIHSSGRIPYSCVLSLVVTLGFTSMCSFVRTFGIPSGLSQRSLRTSSSLHISLWEADLMSNLEGDDDGEENTDQSVQQHKRADQIEIIKYKKHAKKNKGKSWCPFHFYLHQQRGSIRDPSTRALHMDDELNRMESKFYQSGNDDLPQIWFPLDHGFDHYIGNVLRPNERSYELVLHAYFKANLGKEGAERAEIVLSRYEKFNTAKQATTKMMAFVMKAFIAAGDLKRTEY